MRFRVKFDVYYKSHFRLPDVPTYHKLKMYIRDNHIFVVNNQFHKTDDNIYYIGIIYTCLRHIAGTYDTSIGILFCLNNI